jgi:transposase InsO family protein
MDIHKNARLSFRSREILVQQVVEHAVTLKAAAIAFHVSAKTAAKWVGRYRTLGGAGLYDRSSRPHRSPRRLPEMVVAHVIQLRRRHTPGYEIARRTAVSPASISRILRRARLSRWRDLHPAPPVVRYEHAAPGDLLHLDIKGMTRFQQVSWRGDGRRRGRPQFAGWQALHVAVDDHSRMAFTRILPDQKTPTTIAFLRDAVDFFACHGITVRALLTDNGSCYRSHLFRHACLQMGLKHRRTRPYSPQTNGKAERFIQTALREWAYATHWTDSEQRNLCLAPWTDYYNFARPHGSLQYQPPISRSETGTTS